MSDGDRPVTAPLSEEAPTMRQCLAERGVVGWHADAAVTAMCKWLHSWQDCVAGATAEDGRRYLLDMLEFGS